MEKIIFVQCIFYLHSPISSRFLISSGTTSQTLAANIERIQAVMKGSKGVCKKTSLGF